MEKYAVDLEKVLDDFEYRESKEQSHKYTSDQRSLNDSFSCSYNMNDNIFPRHYRTPASNYRRPPFEPMNLADADFSISTKPHSPSPLRTNDSPPPAIVDSHSLLSENIDCILSNSAAPSNGGESSNVDYSFTFNLNEKTDYKPDLIESNADSCSNFNKFGYAERNLPDVASANVASDEDQSTLEVNENERRKEVYDFVDTGKPKLDADVRFRQSQSNQKIITFQMSADVTDHALKQYLDELVENENLSSLNDHTAASSDVSFPTDDVPEEENTEITEDCSCSTTELDDKVNEIDCSSSSSEIEERKFSYSSENDNQDYRILSDNALLISSSVDSQENLESDSVDKNSNATPTDSKPLNDNVVETYLNDGETSGVNEMKESLDNDPSENKICEADLDRNPPSTYENDVVQDDDDGIEENSITNEGDELQIDLDVASKDFKPTSSNELQIHKCEIDSSNKSFERVENKKKSIKDDEVPTLLPEIRDFNTAVDTDCQKFSEFNLNAVACNDVRVDDGITNSVNCLSKYSNSSSENQTSNSSSNLNFETLDSKIAILNLESKNCLDGESNAQSSHFTYTSKDHQSYDTADGASYTNTSEFQDVSVDHELLSNSLTKPQRPDSLNLGQSAQNPDMSSTSADSGSLLSVEERKLGKEAPYWIPDSDTTVCMQCQLKFNPVIRRRHHCRACGLVVCAKCSDKKACLEYLGFKEDRVCHTCHSILQKISNAESDVTSILKRPNPNNPMEYCSTIPPLLQVGSTHHPTPSVLVPKVGVLKREGRVKTNDSPKQVIFSDGIRPGGDLTELDVTAEPRLPLRRSTRVTKRVGTPPGNIAVHRRLLNPDTRSFIPSGANLPPLVIKAQGECTFAELEKPLTVESESVKFAVNRNLFVVVKRLILDCCVHKDVWCVTTEGLSCVGQDEVVFILEVLPEEKHPPKDIFNTVNTLYQEASKGSTVTEMSFAAPCTNQLFGTKEHGGFVFIRPTYQCVQKLFLPKPPFLVALLIHRWETPWARLFPIRLVLRLGAEYRYYPCPLVSVRNRPALFSEIGHTIFTLLADFRKYSYTLPTVRGLMIHMEDRLTTILLPRNRYDQVIRALNNSEENVLAFAGNISTVADSHLVCIQSIQQEDTAYHTQAINILNKPRQITGASFIVFNGSLKQCGWSGKSNIVEDGLMVQIPSESMIALRTALRQMKNYSIGCGPQAEEMVILKWADDDVNFNIGVKSEIDNRALDGIPSIRVHNGIDYSGSLRLIRWTEVFILQSDDESNNRTGDSINISKLSESIAKATCIALVPLLDLLATANLTTLSVRTTIHPENVGYEAGSKGEKLPPIYMKSLDEELIAVIHDAAVSLREILNPIILELIFKVMEQG